MAQRTYIPQLFKIEKDLNDYIARYGVKLEENTEPSVWACIQAVATAVAECLPLIAPAPPED